VPSHITHALFGYKALEAAHIEVSSLPYFTLGCQGPDMFLHGRTTNPSSIPIGRALHHSLFGNFIQAMVQTAHSIEHNWEREIDSFILGYITHALLDRATHPYINYVSGWGPKHHMCHPFLERLIDSWALPQVTQDTVALMDLGPDIPQFLQAVLSSALEKVDLGTEYTSSQIKGSYHATMRILRFTDGWKPELIKQILEIEKEHGRRRLLGLLRPETIPPLDFLNLEHKQWVHPIDETIVSNASFPELFGNGITKAKVVLSNVITAISAEQIGEIVGNEDLNTAFPWSTKPFLYSDPLPLGEAIDSLYTLPEVRKLSEQL